MQTEPKKNKELFDMQYNPIKNPMHTGLQKCPQIYSLDDKYKSTITIIEWNSHPKKN